MSADVTVPPPPPVVQGPPASIRLPLASMLTQSPLTREPVEVASSVVLPVSVPVVMAEVPAPNSGLPELSVVAPVPPCATVTAALVVSTVAEALGKAKVLSVLAGPLMAKNAPLNPLQVMAPEAASVQSFDIVLASGVDEVCPTTSWPLVSVMPPSAVPPLLYWMSLALPPGVTPVALIVTFVVPLSVIPVPCVNRVERLHHDGAAVAVALEHMI